MVALPPRYLFREGIPIAAILLFWNLLAGIVYFPNVAGSIGSAGVVMAALYVAVRGVALSSEVLAPVTSDVTTILYENAEIAVPAGAWFLAAMAAGSLQEALLGFEWFVVAFKTAFAGAGLGVVAIYAVAAGYRALDGGDAAGGGPSADFGDVPETGTGSDETPATEETDGASTDD